MVKTIKKLLQNQQSFEAESLYIASGTKVYQVCSNDGRRLTLTFLLIGQICAHIYLYGENVEKSFSKNVL